MFAIVICLVLLMCTVTICSSVLCVFIVEGVSVVVNIMLYLIIIIIHKHLYSAKYQPSVLMRSL